MSGDLVQRLRGYQRDPEMSDDDIVICGDAADEIERLRAASDEMRANCDAWGVLHGRRMEQIEALRAEVARLMDGMEWAWSLLANVQYWDRTDGRRYSEWNDARLRWRDKHWHPALERNSEVRYEQ